MPGTPTILSGADCRQKMAECLTLAKDRTLSSSQQVMLEHIAMTWGRLADDIDAAGDGA